MLGIVETVAGLGILWTDKVVIPSTHLWIEGISYPSGLMGTGFYIWKNSVTPAFDYFPLRNL